MNGRRRFPDPSTVQHWVTRQATASRPVQSARTTQCSPRSSAGQQCGTGSSSPPILVTTRNSRRHRSSFTHTYARGLFATPTGSAAAPQADGRNRDRDRNALGQARRLPATHFGTNASHFDFAPPAACSERLETSQLARAAGTMTGTPPPSSSRSAMLAESMSGWAGPPRNSSSIAISEAPTPPLMVHTISGRSSEPSTSTS